MYHTQFLNLCVQNTHVDEWQRGICESSHDTVYISSALKTTVPVLEVCRQEGGPVSQAGLWLCLSLRDGARLHPLPSSLPVSLTPGPWCSPLSPGGRALRPAAALASLLRSLCPSPFQLARVLAFPPRETGICRRCGTPCLPRPFGCSLTAVDLSQWFSSLIFLLMALHLTESFPPDPPPFIF